MPSPVQWSGDGVPFSPRFGDDIYHSEAGAIEQARFVFLGGCGLPANWNARAQFTVLELGFGLGLNFLATWQAWLHDPHRAKRLDYVSIEAHPVSREDILRAARNQSASGDGAAGRQPLMKLAEQLADAYPLPLPGLHRIRFQHEGCQLTLTLAIGDATVLLPDLHLAADAVYMDGFSPALNPELWSPAICKGIARLMRPGGRVATWTIAAALRKGLTEAGFKVEKAPGLPPKRDALRAVYAPAWPRPANWPDNTRIAPADHALVIGAGLAGACTAYALSQRGLRVTLLDAHSEAAGGASGLPAGLMVPHVSPDDAPMSRLTRAGAALMRRWIDDIALPRRHWRADGVSQRVDDAHKARAPASWNGLSLFELQQTGTTAARFFADGLAIEPAALVRELLARCPALDSRWNTGVASLARAGHGAGWQALDTSGRVLAQAPLVIVAASLDSLRIAGSGGKADVLRPVRGQVTLGRQALPEGTMPAHALSGDGYFVPALTPDSPWPWLVGASFERGKTALDATDEATAGNLEKLGRLLPAAAPGVTGDFAPGSARSWVQVRCASPDRMPLVGAWPSAADNAGSGLYMLAALGSRGLSLAAICAELLACQISGEPWPVEASLARAVDPARFAGGAS
ncbi:FAD-dependent 5-carboxymethylaminomethyl-2-thiouridine(34) oxidoreductase MnmC [Variovorax sp. VNK109]|uniref:FAD-dependent 5-carboxymethylaminomethyl-2-thiouridine(34) oxidoreductase MnmC n=1 Tax=Variovorax sp. VNK109 TaxID=3400919 RepID=UPI003C103A21